MLESRAKNGFAFERHHVSVFAPAPRSYDIAFGDGETGLPEDADYEDHWRYRRQSGPAGERGVVFDVAPWRRYSSSWRAVS